MSKPIYRYFLSTETVEAFEVFPYWEDVKKEFEIDQSEGLFFNQESISGKFTFTNDDYDFVNGSDYEEEFYFLVEEFIGGNWIVYFTGNFTKQDCFFDQDSNYFEVEPSIVDKHDIIVDNLDTDYDIIGLGASRKLIQYDNYPVIQLYIPRTNQITNLTPGQSFISDTSERDPSDIGPNNFFETSIHPGALLITGVGSGLSPDVSGYYDTSQPGDFIHIQTQRWAITKVFINNGTNVFQWQIVDRNNNNSVVYTFDFDREMLETETTVGSVFDPNAFFQSVTDSQSRCQAAIGFVYSRIITNDETLVIGGNTVNTFEIPENDFAIGSLNYKRAYPYPTQLLNISEGHSVEPTPFGKYPAEAVHWSGQYFTKPPGANNYIPIIRDFWRYAGYWYLYSEVLINIAEDNKTVVDVDGYLLSDVISVLIDELSGGTITHEASEEYSAFLYADVNPITGDNNLTYLLAPMTNVANVGYTQAATKAEIKLNQIINFLWQSFRVGCFLEDNKLRFEHELYFYNGKSYTAAVVGTDLTELREPKTLRAWQYHKNEFDYKTDSVPEFIKSSWAGSTSDVFAEKTVKIVSKYATNGRTDDEPVTRLNPDIIFISSNPDEVIRDDFAIVATNKVNGNYVVAKTLVDGQNVQNGFFAWNNINMNFRTKINYGRKIEINDIPLLTQKVNRGKIQKLTFSSNDFGDPLELIKTGLGEGQIEDYSESMKDKKVTVTILHDVI